MTSTTPSPDPGTPEVQIIPPRLRFWISWVVFGVVLRYFLAKISLSLRLSEWGVLPSPSPEQKEDIEEMRSVLREGIDTHREMPACLEDPGFDPQFDALAERMERLGRRAEARIARRKEQSEEAEQSEDAADAPAAEEEETQDGNLRDHVPVGLDIPIEVFKERATTDVGFWYYVYIKLPNGDEAPVGLVERHEHVEGGHFWAGLAEPDHVRRVREDTMQGAIDALVRYALDLNVELREEMRGGDERIV